MGVLLQCVHKISICGGLWWCSAWEPGSLGRVAEHLALTGMAPAGLRLQERLFLLGLSDFSQVYDSQGTVQGTYLLLG